MWLFSGCFLIFTMVIVGGVTRLTGSGLSMVDWKLFMGAIPPLNHQEWIDAFEQYKQYPEFKERNYMFSLSDFKNIFFWEYIHRVLGRFIGLVFIIPYLYFIIRKRFSKKLIFQTTILLFMGATQGFLGWWMVKSGLVDNPDVSHVRLATHLTTAFLTFSYTFWIALSLVFPKKEFSNKTLYKIYKFSGYIAAIFLILVAVFILICILSRIFDFYIRGLAEYSGYCMASASFFALAYTFVEGGHIRITLFLEKFSGLKKRLVEIWCLSIASFFSGYLAFYFAKMLIISYKFHQIVSIFKNFNRI